MDPDASRVFFSASFPSAEMGASSQKHHPSTVLFSTVSADRVASCILSDIGHCPSGKHPQIEPGRPVSTLPRRLCASQWMSSHEAVGDALKQPQSSTGFSAVHQERVYTGTAGIENSCKSRASSTDDNQVIAPLSFLTQGERPSTIRFMIPLSMVATSGLYTIGLAAPTLTARSTKLRESSGSLGISFVSVECRADMITSSTSRETSPVGVHVTHHPRHITFRGGRPNPARAWRTETSPAGGRLSGSVSPASTHPLAVTPTDASTRRLPRGRPRAPGLR